MKVSQSCRTLCDPMDYTVHEILQARILEWVAFPFFRGSSQHKDQTQISRIAGGFFTNWATEKPQKAALNGTESCCCLVANSCLTLCRPKDSSPPGSSVHGISQTRILEGVAISFSMRSSRPRDRNYISCIDRWILYHWATREAHWILQWRVITFGRVLCN